MHSLLAKAAAFIHTKTALALVGAVLLAGGGTTVALAATHGNPGQLLSGFAAPTHSTHGNSQDGQGSQGTHVSAEGTLTTYDAPSSGTAGLVTVQQNDGTSVAFAVNSDTRVNGAHANTLADLPGVVGSQVQVQGEQQSSGNPLAIKITVQGSANSVELHGTIASINMTGNSFVLNTAGNPVTISVTGDTKFSHNAGGLSGLQLGAQVNVQGVQQPDGSVVATHIETGGGQGPDATHTPPGNQ